MKCLSKHDMNCKPRISDDELDYFINLAVDQCATWLEVNRFWFIFFFNLTSAFKGVTRERLLDPDDFLYSIRYGTQLRKYYY